jgi:spore germination protein GerM
VPARLVSVRRDVGASSGLDPSAVLKALFAGPNVLEQGDDITTVLPAGLEVLRWSSRFGGVVTIDLPEAFRELSGETLTLGLAQIVHTVTAMGGVSGVRITVGQESMGWPDVNGQLQDDPLTVYDYPGLVRTSQPAFPAVPSD